MNKKVYVDEIKMTNLNTGKYGASAKIVFVEPLTAEEMTDIKGNIFLTLSDSRDKKNLIKYLEDKINKCDIDIEETKRWLDEKALFNQVQNDLRVLKAIKRTYKDILERLKSGKYE